MMHEKKTSTGRMQDPPGKSVKKSPQDVIDLWNFLRLCGKLRQAEEIAAGATEEKTCCREKKFPQTGNNLWRKAVKNFKIT